MNIAVTAWGNRISPVFDSSGTLMIATIHQNRITDRKIKSFDPQYPAGYMRILRQYDVDVLICGAITKGHAVMIQAGNVRLVSFVTGDIDTVLALYVKDPDHMAEVLMPGSFKIKYVNPDIS